jgi:hypothetical protein
MSLDLPLPEGFEPIDISDLADVSPGDLLNDPGRLAIRDVAPDTVRALRYARAGPTQAYDEIGFRFVAANPYAGDVPFQTMLGMRWQRDGAERSLLDEAIETIREQQPWLRHRPLALPDTGRFRFVHDGDTITFLVERSDADGRARTDTWTFPLTMPPPVLRERAVPRDAALLAPQQYRLDIPGAHWLPLRALVASGEFRRMQDWREVLVRRTEPGRFYAFLSHRWLSPARPDPEHRQATFVAWQLVAAMCEAVRVAHERGLQAPRQFSPDIGSVVGIAGSELAEALLVNVLRPALDEHTVAAAAAEIAAIDAVMADAGVAAARDDIGLTRLRAILDERPILSSLVDRVLVWYDYACIPQAPRDEADQAIFRDGLEYLLAIQVVARTVIVLDEADDYFSRAWCTLEALVADGEAGARDLLVGSARRTVRAGETEHFFATLVEDRPHLVWRALLDTELFGVQTTEQCMRRLGLAVTDAGDLPYLYGRVRHLRAPTKIHTDPSEVVTGIFPLPVIDGGTAVLMPRQGGRRVTREVERRALGTLDWTAVLRMTSALGGDRSPSAAVPPFETLAGAAPRTAPGHVVVIGACEGEAVLIARWVRDHRSEFDALLDRVSIVSSSWIASDIAPVGHLVHGRLAAHPIDAAVWIIVTMGMRLEHCHATSAIVEAVLEAGRPCLEVRVDEANHNVVVVIPRRTEHPADGPGEGFERVTLAGRSFPDHVGGLFRRALLHDLI